MSRPLDCSAPLPRTLERCVIEIGRITREKARELDQNGENQRVIDLTTRLERVKEHRSKLQRKAST